MCDLESGTQNGCVMYRFFLLTVAFEIVRTFDKSRIKNSSPGHTVYKIIRTEGVTPFCSQAFKL